jgi:hypothetical protein
MQGPNPNIGQGGKNILGSSNNMGQLASQNLILQHQQQNLSSQIGKGYLD